MIMKWLSSCFVKTSLCVATCVSTVVYSQSSFAEGFEELSFSNDAGIRLQQPEFPGQHFAPSFPEEEAFESPFGQDSLSQSVQLVGFPGEIAPEDESELIEERDDIVVVAHHDQHYVDHSSMSCNRPYYCQFLPEGLLYKSYLAGQKESRFSSAWLYESGRGWIWDVTLGGRVGVFRNGTRGPINPEGFQVDIEGAALVRLDLEESQDVDATDYRFGVPFTWKKGRTAYKLGYYHISSHLGDEYMVKQNSFDRINYVRESLVAGMSYQYTEDVNIYGEIGYAVMRSGGAEPLEFQFGAEYSPIFCSGKKSSPFAAINFLSREDFDFNISTNVLAGWQWRSGANERLWRFGLQYYNGESPQYSFFDKHEELVGLALLFDY